MSTKIQVPRAAMKAMLLFAAVRDIRYYLQGVLVEATPTATRLVATNGHILAVHHTAQTNEVDAPTSLIVPRQAIELLRPLAPKNRLLRDVQLERVTEGWLLRDYTNGIRLGFDAIEAKFPNYGRVIPETISGERGAFNPAYLAVIDQAAKVLKSEARHVSIGHNGDRAAIARIGNVPEFLAVVMPMRDDFKAERPEWLERPLMPAELGPEPVTPAAAPEREEQAA